MKVSQLISTNQPVQANQIHNIFASLNFFNELLLLFGIIIYIFSPILGCVFILLSLQIKLSKRFSSKFINRSGGLPKKIELFLILLILFAITIYGSTFTAQTSSDLATYISIYNLLQTRGIDGLFSLYAGRIYSTNIEPITFVIPQLMGMLFGYHDNYFIIIQSFTFNFIFTAFAYTFFPFLYPIIILINITSGVVSGGTSIYFFNMFLMRQFYSYIFIIFMAFTPSLIINSIFLFLTFLTHKSSIIFSFPLSLTSLLFLFKDNSWVPIKFKFIKIIRSISIFLIDRKIVLALLILGISFIFYPLFIQTYIDNFGMKEAYEYYNSDLSATGFRALDRSWIMLNMLPETFLFIFSISYFRNSLFFFLSPRKYVAETSFFVICIIVISLFSITLFIGLNEVFLRPISCFIATKGFLYGFVIEKLNFPITDRRNTTKSISIRFTALLVVVFILFSLGIWFYRNLVMSYYFLFQSDDFLTRSVYENVTVINGLPTLFSNLFDYLYRFYQLIFP